MQTGCGKDGNDVNDIFRNADSKMTRSWWVMVTEIAKSQKSYTRLNSDNSVKAKISECVSYH